MREWKTWHQNARVGKSRCDINCIVLPEKHVHIQIRGKNVGPHIVF